jgi:glucose-6-phosphate dehydrogenase assembly protein OpcA
VATALTGGRWSARDTTTDVVGDALRRLLREAEHDDGHHAASHTLNLIVAPGDPHRIAAGTRSVRASHPARTIHLHEHDHDRLDAEVHVESVALRGGGLRLLLERIELRANHTRLQHARSLLTPLMARGIPSVAWLPGEEHGDLEEALAAVAHVTVVDSDHCLDPDAALAFVRALGERHPVRDLAWLRTMPWRLRVANAFTTPERIDALARTPQATVRGRVETTAIRLFAAWLATRGDLEVAIESGRGPEPIETVVVAGIPIAGEEHVRCDRSTLGDALDTVYAPPRGYDAALDGLGRVTVSG